VRIFTIDESTGSLIAGHLACDLYIMYLLRIRSHQTIPPLQSFDIRAISVPSSSTVWLVFKAACDKLSDT
jgi:hypothetical protein